MTNWLDIHGHMAVETMPISTRPIISSKRKIEIPQVNKYLILNILKARTAITQNSPSTDNSKTQIIEGRF